MPGDAGHRRPASGAGPVIPALLVPAPDQPADRSAPVCDWLAVGRECAGVEDRHRLLTDRSTNGTRLNGQRIERSVPGLIRPPARRAGTRAVLAGRRGGAGRSAAAAFWA
jgi:hypothetical protein